MKTRILPIFLFLTAAISFIIWDQSNDKSAALENRIDQLEERKERDLERQRELEQELASHKLAMEWEAIERERQEIEARRLQLEGKDISNQDREYLKMRKDELAEREKLAEEQQAKMGDNFFFPPGGNKLPKEDDFPFLGLEAGSFADSFATTTSTVDYDYFDDALAPYGTWYDTDEYGSVWQPAACQDPDWRPYTRGHWVCSDRGWVWVSCEPFGWATYHYGRWALTQSRGWIWVPGTEWAPNWCTWRCNDAYIGWAPLPPETLAYRNCPWDSHVEHRFGIGGSCYNFVKTRHFGHYISRHCVQRYLIPNCLKVTNNVTNIKVTKGQIFCGGPGYHELSKKLGRQLPYYQVHQNRNSYERYNPTHLRSRVQGDRLLVAAPAIRKTGSIVTSRRLVGIKTERSETADPKAIAAYHEMRRRQVNPSATVNTTASKPAPTNPLPARPVSRPTGPIATSKQPAPPSGTRIASKPNNVPSPDSARIAKKRSAEAQLEAFRKMAREQRAISTAEKARRKKAELAAAAELAELSRQKRETQEAQQKIAAQQTQREVIERRSKEEAEQKQRNEQQRQRSLEEQRRRDEITRQQQQEAQRRQEAERKRIAEQQMQQELARRAQEEARRRQQEDQQRRAREEAQRRQQEQAQRQRAEEQRRAREDAQRRQQEQAQRQQREEQQRRAQEQAQRQQREEQQRQRQRQR